MNAKRVSSIIVITAMILTMFSTLSFAIPSAGYSISYENITRPGQSIEKDDVFYAVIKLVNATTVASGQISLEWDPAIVTSWKIAGGEGPATAVGNAADLSTAITSKKVMSNITFTDVPIMESMTLAYVPDNTNGKIVFDFSPALVDGAYNTYTLTSGEIENGLIIIKFRFKALNNGNAGFSYTQFDNQMKYQALLGGLMTYPTTGITPLTIGPVGPTEYDVTFDLNYVDAPAATVVATVDGKVTAPANPSRSNYTFGGWFTDAECTASFDFDSTISSATTVYAKWTLIPPTYTLTKGTATNGTITFNPQKASYDEGDFVEVTATPNTGYEFVEFTGGLEGITENPKTITVTSNMTIGATFALIQTDDPTAAIGSATQNVYVGTTVKVPVTIQNVPAGTKAINFSFSFEDDDLTYNSVTLSSKLSENGIETATGAVAVAALVKDGETLADNDVIAEISFTVKSGVATGTESLLELYNVKFGLINVLNLLNGKIVVSEPTDENYPAAVEAVNKYKDAPLTTLTQVAAAELLYQPALDAIDALDDIISAQAIIDLTKEVDDHKLVVDYAKARLTAEKLAEDKVAEYETGALDSLANVAIAEGKKLAADNAVAALATYPESTTLKSTLEGKIADRASDIADARENLEKEASLVKINDGSFDTSDLAKLGVTPASIVADKIKAYKIAAQVAKVFNNSDVEISELQSIIDAANAVTPEQIGKVINGSGKVLAEDARVAKDHSLSRRAIGSLTRDEFIQEAIRADIDGNGIIESGDITDILIQSAKDNINKE